jgi:uncharacterized protein (TIGR03083 family)
MIETLHLFRPLQEKLHELLSGLSESDWSKKTVAGTWTVKDVTGHLLDVTLRDISMYRDLWELPPADLKSYPELVAHLNTLNGDWVNAMRRVSPQILIEWLHQSQEAYIQCLERLDPTAPSKYSVAWAGEQTSTNWFHIAREYTEVWHHQQQIREAVGISGILTRQFYHPALDTFVQALPFQYRNTNALEGTRIALHIDSDAGGTWYVEKHIKGWALASPGKAVAELMIPAELAWKLFTKAVRYEQVKERTILKGEESLLIPALRMISVIA